MTSAATSMKPVRPMPEFARRLRALFTDWSVPAERVERAADHLHAAVRRAAADLSPTPDLEPATADSLGAFVELYAAASPALRRVLTEPGQRDILRATPMLDQAVKLASASTASAIALQAAVIPLLRADPVVEAADGPQP